MSRGRFVLLFSLALTALMASETLAAYHLVSAAIDHRRYENGTVENKLWFSLKDERGQYASEDLLTSITLHDSKGEAASLSKVSFGTDDKWLGEYDGNNGQWRYDGVYYESTGYLYLVDSELVQGAYSLTVTYDGLTSTISTAFNGMVKLPALKITSLQSNILTKSGELISSWTVSTQVFDFTYANPSVSIYARAVIDVYNKGKPVGYLAVKLPAHMGRLYVPERIASLLKSRGDKCTLRLQLRTADSNNRYYSNTVPLSALSGS